MSEINSRIKYKSLHNEDTIKKEQSPEQILLEQDHVSETLSLNQNLVVKVTKLIVIVWLLYTLRVEIFILKQSIFAFLIQFSSNIGILNEHTAYSILAKHKSYLGDDLLITTSINYGVVFFIIGFVDKFFPETFPWLLRKLEKLRNTMPSFIFSGLMKFFILFLEIFIKLNWIFSSSFVRFFTSLFNFIFTLLYTISIPVFKLFMKVLDELNSSLDKASQKMDNTSKKLGK